MALSASVPATVASGQGSSPPVCQNCSTSTTPLWRRDELGSVLCNACGLFLKLHGRSRPISLKTDVIKSRNRVKTGQGPKKRASFETNGSLPATAAPPPIAQTFNNSVQQPSQTSHQDADRSRSGTPHRQNPNIAPQHLFDSVTAFDSLPQQSSLSPSLPQFSLRQPSPSASHIPASSGQLNGTSGHLEPPQGYDAIVSLNTSLKTRVSELEVINDLFRGRVAELEKSEREVRQAEEGSRAEIEMLRNEVEELKRKLAGAEAMTLLDVINGNAKRNGDEVEEDGKSAKRQRVEDNQTADADADGDFVYLRRADVE
ncbi:MAG: hypothetical protein M1820_008464 [Bogoriella megaspora]|nr:MAG: hypothetical protein M1820_008464 [Bogoriella megaspora]